MASTIKSDNGVSSGVTGIVQTADSSGQLALQTTSSGGVATTALTIDNNQIATFANTLKAPNLQAPAFSAYLSSSQNITSNTITQAQINTKDFDTGTCYNNTGSTVTLNGLSVPAYSFCPTIAGYYQINAAINATNASTTDFKSTVYIYKNGSSYKLVDVNFTGGTGAFNDVTAFVGAVVYLNGTGDYISIYGIVAGSGSPQFGGTNTWVSGSMARSA
jgi:hypothetical protein